MSVQSPAPRRKRAPARSRFARVFRSRPAVFLAAALGLACLAIGVMWLSLPRVADLKDLYPVVVPQDSAKEKGKAPLIKMESKRPPGWTALTEIPRAVVGAVVVSEDGTFFEHEGFDPAAVKEALKEDWERKKFAFGGSTITQQVVKNVYLNRQKSLFRKLKEFYLAVKLDQAVTKRRILEVYFNVVEWGDGIYGIRQASRRYFQKSPSELNPKEGAFLAMLLPSPKRYSVSFRKRELTRYARRTIDSLLKRMSQTGYLTADERDRWRSTPFSFEPTASSGDSIPSADPSELDSSPIEDETVLDAESE